MIKINDTEIERSYFPDGTFNLTKLPEPDPHGVYEILWMFEEPAEQILLYNLVHHYKNVAGGYSSMGLILPYVPNARMDRTKSDTECNTLKWFCQFINDLKFDYVSVLDPHSDATTNFLNRAYVLMPTTTIEELIHTNHYDTICFPDNGAYKKYSYYFSRNNYLKNVRYIYCEKHRDWKTGIIQSLTLSETGNLGKVLVVDDICSRGGTLYYTSKALLENGATQVDCWVTHCEHSIFAGKLLSEDSPITNIYTTNSIFKKEHNKIQVFEVQPEEEDK